jgi:hypothetical protein
MRCWPLHITPVGHRKHCMASNLHGYNFDARISHLRGSFHPQFFLYINAAGSASLAIRLHIAKQNLFERLIVKCRCGISVPRLLFVPLFLSRVLTVSLCSSGSYLLAFSYSAALVICQSTTTVSRLPEYVVCLWGGADLTRLPAIQGESGIFP